LEPDLSANLPCPAEHRSAASCGSCRRRSALKPRAYGPVRSASAEARLRSMVAPPANDPVQSLHEKMENTHIRYAKVCKRHGHQGLRASLTVYSGGASSIRPYAVCVGTGAASATGGRCSRRGDPACRCRCLYLRSNQGLMMTVFMVAPGTCRKRSQMRLSRRKILSALPRALNEYPRNLVLCFKMTSSSTTRSSISMRNFILIDLRVSSSACTHP
jgi:hypothetical protein